MQLTLDTMITSLDAAREKIEIRRADYLEACDQQYRMIAALVSPQTT